MEGECVRMDGKVRPKHIGLEKRIQSFNSSGSSFSPRAVSSERRTRDSCEFARKQLYFPVLLVECGKMLDLPTPVVLASLYNMHLYYSIMG